MNKSEKFKLAWKLAKQANKSFGYWGGSKQYFPEALRLVNAGVTELLTGKQLLNAERLIGCRNLTADFNYIQLGDCLFLINTNNKQFVYCKQTNTLSINQRFEQIKKQYKF